MWRGAASRALVAAMLSAAAWLAAPAPARAQTEALAPAEFELSRSVQQTFKRLQELWLQWLGASLQDDPAKAAETMRLLQATARQIGFGRLPDLASGAAARALQSAREGDFERARRELEAAEALDPGRPDLAFAAAKVARGQGAWGRTTGAIFDGFRRLIAADQHRTLGARSALWALLVLLVAAALFVAAQAVAHGADVYREVHGWLAARVPSGLAHVVAIALLIGPAALPGGPVWLLLGWSALLWGHGSASARAVFAGVWLTVALAPFGTASLQRELALRQSPPLRAIDQFESGRLAGTLFSDVQVLRQALPEEPAVLELVADLHRSLGQWEIARPLYRKVIALDSAASTALINLGADAFRKGDFATANEHFRRAAEGEPPSAAAWYNLSLSFSESYQFEESRRALARAREIDSERVDAWIQTPNPDRVLTFNGGVARRAEIAGRLRAVWSANDRAGNSFLRRLERLQPPIAAGIAALAAVGLHFARRGRYPDAGRNPGRNPARRPGAVERWARALLPAVAHCESGRGFAAAANVLMVTVLVLLPGMASLGGDFAAAAPVRMAVLGAAAAGVLAYVSVRIRRELAEGGD